MSSQESAPLQGCLWKVMLTPFFSTKPHLKLHKVMMNLFFISNTTLSPIWYSGNCVQIRHRWNLFMGWLLSQIHCVHHYTCSTMFKSLISRAFWKNKGISLNILNYCRKKISHSLRSWRFSVWRGREESSIWHALFHYCSWFYTCQRIAFINVRVILNCFVQN
jgi:hypothetical protein